MYLVRPPYLLQQLYPQATWRMSPAEKVLYLTFDDGPIAGVTEKVLDILEEQNIRATFFCVGENAGRHPEILKRALDAGHRLGNHTYNHLRGWDCDTRKYLRNVQKCAAIVDSDLFRPPYGKAKRSQMAILIKRYRIIMWDVLSGDYDRATSPEQCLDNVTKNIRNGSIIVFHDSLKAADNMLYALPKFIAFAKKEGFSFGLL
jgi:peptidoglycan/xylan/chitin deacetylase (PgdA/CDA1 family)